MIKILGIILILVACTFIGFAVEAWHNDRVKELEELVYAFELLKGEIDYRLTPLTEACQTVNRLTKNRVGYLFEGFGEHIRKRHLTDTKEMWEQTLRDHKHLLHLTEEDYIVLAEFGNIVGYLDKEMQKRNIDLLLIKLEKIRDEAKEKYRRTSKMYKGLGVLVGVCISIVLI